MHSHTSLQTTLFPKVEQKAEKSNMGKLSCHIFEKHYKIISIIMYVVCVMNKIYIRLVLTCQS